MNELTNTELDLMNDECIKCGEDKVVFKQAIMSRSIMNRKDLTVSAKQIYILVKELTTERGYCFASNDFLMKELNMSRNSIVRGLQKLDEVDLIVRKTYTSNNKTKRYIYVTGCGNENRVKSKSGEKIKEVKVLDDNDISFFNDMWKKYTIEFVRNIKNEKNGNHRNGGSKSKAKEKFRAILKAGINTDQVQDFVVGLMDTDYPKDLERVLDLKEIKLFVSDGVASSKLVKLRDIATGKIEKLTEEEAIKKEGQRWRRV